LHLALIGFRCSGKTTVGRLLAEQLDRKFIDTDELAEKLCGLKVRHFVALEGWAQFRRLETLALETALDQDYQIIATGGGIVLQPENVLRLKRKATVFWLRASTEAIRRRLSRDSERVSRPGLTRNNPVEEVEALLQQRTPLYLKASDYVVDTDHEEPRTVMEAICRLIEAQQGKRR